MGPYLFQGDSPGSEEKSGYSGLKAHALGSGVKLLWSRVRWFNHA